MSNIVQNDSDVSFTYALSNFLGSNGLPVDPFIFADAGAPVMYLIDSSGKKLGPFAATLDYTNAKNFSALQAVYDPYVGVQSALNPLGWVQGGNGYLSKTWFFQFMAPKGGTTTFYESALVPFQVSPNAADVGT